MATIYKDIVIKAPPAHVWAAVRDFQAAPARLFPGVLTDSKAKAGGRVVTFANGLVVTELLVSSDEVTRRLAFTAVEGTPATHHNASLQVFDHGQGESRLVWITDVLPNEMGEPVRALVDQGAVVLKETLEQSITS
jgi:carbon monoxide dehydrogenase subunit G